MSFSELKSFDAVAKYGSFVKAADKLNRTQPTVTMQVSQLEKNFDVELVVRSRGKVLGLTPLGESLYVITKHIFALEEDAIGLLKDAGAMNTGEFRVSSTAPGMAIRIIEQFSRQFPRIDVNLHFGNSETILQSILDCDTDIGIVGGHADHPECLATPIAKPEIVMVCHKQHPAVKKGYISKKEFSKETLLIREQGSETRDLLLAQMRSRKFKPAKYMEIGSREGAVAAAAAGMGLAPVSEYEIKADGDFGRIRFEGFRVFGINYAVCLKRRAKNRLIGAILSSAEECILDSEVCTN